MPDVFEVADVLVSRVIAAHGDDIDVIATYGSYAQGVADDDSDLDLFYVPRDGTDPPVGATFLLDGVLFDFWRYRGTPWRGSPPVAFAGGRSRRLSPITRHYSTPDPMRCPHVSRR